MKKISLALALGALLLAGCAGSGPSASTSATATPTQTALPTPSLIGTPGASACQPASPINNSSVGPEVQGTAANASLWLLLFGPTKTGDDLKIVWRMTGTGDLHLVAIGPQGQQVAPDWGPEAHESSNWNRPGDEWGAGFTIPVAGCWDLRASRGDVSGDAWLIFTT
jgi:hypothetical protein